MKQAASYPIDINRINFRLLYYFKIVAEELSFSKAALRLNMSQPPLSRHIKELEDQLETQLLIRTTRSVELTLAGRVLFRDVERLLKQASQSVDYVRQLGRGEKGHMVIGVVGTAVWGVLLPALRLLTEKIQGISWSLIELSPEQQIEALHNHHIDMGVLRDTYAELPIHLSHQLLTKEVIVLAVSEQHPLAKCSNVQLTALKDEQFILFRAQQSSFGRYIDNICEQHAFKPDITYHVNEPQTALALVAEGYGITLIPESYAQIGWPGICIRPLLPIIPANLHMIYDASNLTPVVQAFLEMVAEK